MSSRPRLQGRIPVLPIEEAQEAARSARVPDIMAPLSIFRILLRHPPVAKVVADLLSTLLGGKLDTRLRELVIMRIGWQTGSVYEWTQHWRIARALDISEQDLLGVRDWRSCPEYGPTEHAVLAATDETLEHGAILPETWAKCEAQLGEASALLELVGAIGCWRFISSLLRSLEVPLEQGVEAWPPDGRRPPSAS